MSSSFGIKQLEILRDIGTVKNTLHCGCFGCGKTYGVEAGIGFISLRLQQLGITGLKIVLVGQTIGKVKTNQCDVLAELYGDNFEYNTSKKDGKTKDAVLFGQNLFFIGLNDKSSEKRFRGMSNIFCIIHDEACLASEEQFKMLQGRLRGEFSAEVMKACADLGLVPSFYIGSTNPDVPVHWLKKLMDSGFFDIVKDWTMQDARWKGAVDYYNNLKKLYAGNDVLIDRYLYGKWVSAEGLVWSAFNYKKHVIDINDVDIDYAGFKRLIVGIDWGSNHDTSVAVVGYSDTKEYVVLESHNFNNTAPSDLMLEILPIINALPFCNQIYVDGAGKAYNDELLKCNINFVNAIKDHEYIPAVNSLFANNRLFIMSNLKDLINHIYSYKYKENSVDDAINRIEDDDCDAIRYAVISDMKNNIE